MPSPPELSPEKAVDPHGVDDTLRLLTGRFEPSIRGRVSQLLRAASVAILQLSDLDLVRHEADADIGSHTLAMWEELAPLMVATVESVNHMVATAQAAFPPPPEQDLDDNLDDAFGPSPGAGAGGGAAAEEAPASLESEIASLTSAVSSGLRRDVARLGERLRNPTVVADPWNLVSDLLEFRGRLRAGIGELIYQVASHVGEVDRAEVVPGYAADLAASLLVRAACTNLSFLFRAHAKRVAASTEARVNGALKDALRDIHAFSRTRALPLLRTSDKRIFLESRASLHRLVKAVPPEVRETKQAVENLARFLDSLSVISRRENLRTHDRGALAEVGRHLEAAQARAATRDQARDSLCLAVQAAWTLYGRDAQLDTYLRAQRHFSAAWIADGEVENEVERLGDLIAAVAPP